MGAVIVSSETETLISKILESKSGPQALALRLHNRGVYRDEADNAAKIYAIRSGKDAASVHAAIDKAYEKALKPQAAPVFKTVSLYETFHRDFPKEAWIIEPVLHIGANNLSADPKGGKSYLCLQISACVAQQRALFGHYRVSRSGPVLYLALEDGERRIHDRMHDLGMTDRDLQNVTMIYDITHSLSTPEGKEAIEIELQRQHDTGKPYVLFVLDTLAAGCEELAGGGSDVFRKQYGEMKYFQQLAERWNLAALISTHNRKGESKVPLEKMGGTFGRAAAVNGNIVNPPQFSPS